MVIRLINKNILNTSKALNTIADGNLNVNISTTQRNEFSKMIKSLGTMQSALKEVIDSANIGSNTVEGTSKDLTQLSETMSQSAEQVSAAMQEISSKSMVQLESLNVMDDEITALDEVLEAITGTVNVVRTQASDTGRMASESSVSLTEITESIPDIIESFADVTDKIQDLNSQITTFEVFGIAHSIMVALMAIIPFLIAWYGWKWPSEMT